MADPKHIPQVTVVDPPKAIALEDWKEGTIAWKVMNGSELDNLADGHWSPSRYDWIATRVVLLRLTNPLGSGFRDGVPGFAEVERLDYDNFNDRKLQVQACYHGYHDCVYRTARDAVYGYLIDRIKSNRKDQERLAAMSKYFVETLDGDKIDP